MAASLLLVFLRTALSCPGTVPRTVQGCFSHGDCAMRIGQNGAVVLTPLSRWRAGAWIRVRHRDGADAGEISNDRVRHTADTADTARTRQVKAQSPQPCAEPGRHAAGFAGFVGIRCSPSLSRSGYA